MDNRSFESGASATPPVAPASPSVGYPTNGNPTLAIPATLPGDYWFYQFGEELRAIITAGGISPNTATLNQLLLALRSSGVFTTAAAADNTTKVATTAHLQANVIGGIGQSWQNLIDSRSAETIYTNSTGRPIQVIITGANSVLNSTITMSLSVAGSAVSSESQPAGNIGTTKLAVSAIVPNGATYQLSTVQTTISSWYELR